MITTGLPLYLALNFTYFLPFTPAQWLVHNQIQYPSPENISDFSVFLLITILITQVICPALELAV